jgi:GNAT superfamily N-acetyltransferase
MVTIRELGDLDVAAAGAVVARGMRDNPLHIAAFGDDADARYTRLARLFSLILPVVISKGTLLGAFDGPALVGVAGMTPPGRCQPTTTEKLRFMPRIVPAVGGGAFARVGQWVSIWAQHDWTEPHWHLGPVAVDADLQGRGIGSRLMTEYCARVDRLHAAGYLETDKAINVPFYERFGFETMATAPVLAVPNWFMKRVAR